MTERSEPNIGAAKDRTRAESDALVLDHVRKTTGGIIPPQIRLMSRKAGTRTTFMAHKRQTVDEGPLSAREASLIALAAAVVVRSRDRIRTHAAAARKAGATEEEVVQAALIAGYVAGTSPLRTAGEAICPE